MPDEQQMKWYKLDPKDFKSEKFGLTIIHEIECTNGYGKGEIRLFVRDGWKTFAEFLDYNPITKKPLRLSQWWIFAAKGENKKWPIHQR